MVGHDPRGAREFVVVLALAVGGLALAAAVTLGPHLGVRPQAPTVSVVDVIGPDTGTAPLP